MSYEFLSDFFYGVIFIVFVFLVVHYLQRESDKEDEIRELSKHSNLMKDYKQNVPLICDKRKEILKNNREIYQKALLDYEDYKRAEEKRQHDLIVRHKKQAACIYKYQDELFRLFSQSVGNSIINHQIIPSAIIAKEQVLSSLGESVFNELLACDVISEKFSNKGYYSISWAVIDASEELSAIGIDFSQWLKEHFSEEEITEKFHSHRAQNTNTDDLPF